MDGLGRWDGKLPFRTALADWRSKQHAVGAAKALFLGLLAYAMLATPGFFSAPSILATLDYAALMGLVAIGMAFVTISGNIMSFALSATMAACAQIFLLASGSGILPAMGLALAAGVVISGIQGFFIGSLRANPIIVSIAAFALIHGIVTAVTGGARAYPAAGVDIGLLRGHLGPLQAPLIVFVAAAVLAQWVLSFTRFGRNVFLVGSNFRAAEAAGIETWRTVCGAYCMAGLFTACAGIMAAARYRTADLELGAGYDYEAIAAVLLGGTIIQGGSGAAWRVVMGAVVFAAVGTLLVLRGYSTEIQHLLTGVLIFGVICLQAGGDER